MPITREDIKRFEEEQQEALHLFCTDLRVALIENEEKYRNHALIMAHLHHAQMNVALFTLYSKVSVQLSLGKPDPESTPKQEGGEEHA